MPWPARRRGASSAAPYDDGVRFVWLIALLVLAAAAAAVVWPRGVEMPQAPRAEANNAGSPSDVSTAAPHEPAQPSTGGLSDLLPAAKPSQAKAELTMGPPPAIERVDERTARLDGKYLVRGTGQQDDPYQITWDLLTSAAATMDPQRNTYELPGRLAGLQDSWVQISGYWAAPLARDQTSEVMVMLNRWDGCCIGKPPTPFDCMDVTLAAPIRVTGQHLFRYGTVRGRLHIEPLAVGIYLLSLYQLQDAVLESS